MPVFYCFLLISRRIEELRWPVKQDKKPTCCSRRLVLLCSAPFYPGASQSLSTCQDRRREGSGSTAPLSVREDTLRAGKQKGHTHTHTQCYTSGPRETQTGDFRDLHDLCDLSGEPHETSVFTVAFFLHVCFLLKRCARSLLLIQVPFLAVTSVSLGQIWVMTPTT